MKTENFTAALCGVVLCALIPASAAAQDAPPSERPGQGDTVIAGLGVAAVPRFEGGDSYRPVPLPVLRANRQYRYISVEGPVTRVNIVDSPDVEFGPLVNIVLNRSGDLGSDAVEALDSVKVAAEAGAFVA
jgi:outer membrane protein